MSREQTVFVVHGRNKDARNAMFTFLRSLGLNPLEWDQARAKTDQGSPTTLEIVKAGIDAAQCTVVLFTGDDVASLQAKYGNEELEPQPRPNVIFEAGWSLATAGQKRTVLLKIGKVREFSDIEGLNQIDLDNTAAKRKELVERLKTAGCTLDDSGSDYLSPASGGRFPEPDEVSASGLQSDDLERGKFTNFVADSALLYTVSPIDSLTTLRNVVRKGCELDLKYHYIGATCASYWIDLAGHPDYGHEELRNTIETCAKGLCDALRRQLSETGDKVDLISLGPGDGKIDARLLLRMTGNGIQVPYYYCIDISFELLQRAVAEILNSKFLNRQTMRIKAIYGDFMELENLAPIYRYDPTRNLFSLLGNTIGNYNESTLLRAISKGMNSDDLLLVDARLHALDWDGERPLEEEEKRTILRGYAHDTNNQFAFGPVERATAANTNEVTFGYRVDTRITNVEQAANIVTYCQGLKTRLKSSGKAVKRNRLDLAVTTVYSYDALKRWFPRRGFTVLWSDEQHNTGLFLLEKQKTLLPG